MKLVINEHLLGNHIQDFSLPFNSRNCFLKDCSRVDLKFLEAEVS